MHLLSTRQNAGSLAEKMLIKFLGLEREEVRSCSANILYKEKEKKPLKCFDAAL